MLRRYGDQRFVAAPSLRSATDSVPLNGHPVAEAALVGQLQLQPHTIREEPFSPADHRWADEHLKLVSKPALSACAATPRNRPRT